MATDTYSAIYKVLRDRMLAFNNGTTLNALGFGVYQEDVPAGQTKYMVMRIINDTTTNSEYGDRIEADLELMVYSRPRASLAANRSASDLVDQALKKFTAADSGFLRVNSRDRNAIPQGTGDADPEVVQTRLLFHFFVWPLYLTSY